MVGEGDGIYANDHPYKVEIEGGVVTPEEFEELEKKVDALATDLSYKGGVPTYDDLPEDPEQGDVYTVEDTGVLYVWDGDEWVALNETKESIITLTTDDYNWPTSGTKTAVAWWLLPTGDYKGAAGVAIKLFSSSNMPDQPIFRVQRSDDNRVSLQMFDARRTDNAREFGLFFTTNATNLNPTVTSISVRNNLTDSNLATHDALSSYQGYVLNNHIGNLSNLTTTAKTSAVAAINELAPKVVKTLQPSDVNWQDPNNSDADTIALWLLPDGVYQYNQNVENMPPVAFQYEAGEQPGEGWTNLLDTQSSTIVLSPFSTWEDPEDPTHTITARRIDILTVNQSAPDNNDPTIRVIHTGENGEYYGFNDFLTLDGNIKAVRDIAIAWGYDVPTSSTFAGDTGKVYVFIDQNDNNTPHIYICTAIDWETDPENPTFTWEEYGGGPNVVQTTGTSTTDVMSQKAVTEMVYTSSGTGIRIGYGTAGTNHGMAIGYSANTKASNNGISIGEGADTSAGQYQIALGSSAKTVAGTTAKTGGNGFNIAIGRMARVNGGSGNLDGAVALGYGAKPTRQGEVNISTLAATQYVNCGFNDTRYRVIGGVHDGQTAHDAATVGQLPATLTNSQFNSILENA